MKCHSSFKDPPFIDKMFQQNFLPYEHYLQITSISKSSLRRQVVLLLSKKGVSQKNPPLMLLI